MSFFSRLFDKSKPLPFIGVSVISVKDFNDRKCPKCKTYTIYIDEYETVPVAFCKKCNGEFQIE